MIFFSYFVCSYLYSLFILFDKEKVDLLYVPQRKQISMCMYMPIKWYSTEMRIKEWYAPLPDKKKIAWNLSLPF